MLGERYQFRAADQDGLEMKSVVLVQGVAVAEDPACDGSGRWRPGPDRLRLAAQCPADVVANAGAPGDVVVRTEAEAEASRSWHQDVAPKLSIKRRPPRCRAVPVLTIKFEGAFERSNPRPREPGGRRHLSLLVVGRCPSSSAPHARAERDEYAWPRPADC